MFDTEKFIGEIEARAPLYDVNSKLYSNREVKAECWYQVGSIMYDDWDILEEDEKDNRVKDMTKRWKAIRDAFVKDQKVMASATDTTTGKERRRKKRYCYYENLLFLLPYIKGNPNASSNIDPMASDTDKTFLECTLDFGALEDHSMDNNDNNDADMQTALSTSYNTARVGRRTVKRKLNQTMLSSKKSALTSFASSTKDLTNILAQNFEMQREDRNSDQFGHKTFLLSFVPVLNSLPLHAAMQLRGQISNIFSKHFEPK